MMCLAGFSMMYVLSYICAETDSIFLLALCSVLMFIPILTVGGVYSVNSTEMMSGLGIISEHITFTNICFFQCRGIIHTVSCHGNDISPSLPAFYNADLIFR